MKSVMIGFRVSEVVNSQLKELADKRGVTVSAYVKALVEGFLTPTVNKVRESVNTDLETRLEKAGLNLDGNRVSPALQSTTSPLKEESNSRLPLYNPTIHKQGDRVRMIVNGKMAEVSVPELDSEGEPTGFVGGSGATGQLVSDNPFEPSFQPDPKPEKKVRRTTFMPKGKG